MPTIIPIKELKDTARISRLVQESSEPIFITKNGYGDMVLMNMQIYEQVMLLNQISVRLAESENDFSEGKTVDAIRSLDNIQAKYGL